MKILMLVVGETDEDFVKTGIELYQKRLKHYVDFSIEEVAFPKHSGKLHPETARNNEAAALLKRLQAGDYPVLLDEKGKMLSSVAFSKYIEKKQLASVNRLVFIVGGHSGFGEEIRKVARESVSLSSMTFTHQMVRLFFVEQLYRAFTIIRGEKYHRI